LKGIAMPDTPASAGARFDRRSRRWSLAAGSALSILLAGCLVHLVSYYDSVSYQRLTDLKAAVSVLFDELAQDPTGRTGRKEMAALRLEIEKAYEYEKGKAKNDETAAQLAAIRDLYGRIFALLQQQGKLSPAYLMDKKEQMMAAFDLAIRTERTKIDTKQ
jgi:hypothetical protein